MLLLCVRARRPLPPSLPRQSLASHFAGIEQDDDKSSILPFIEQLVQPGFLGHRDKDVRLYVSCCLSDVFRVYAPESPYTNSQNKKVSASPPSRIVPSPPSLRHCRNFTVCTPRPVPEVLLLLFTI